MSALATIETPEVIAAAERIRGCFGRAVMETIQIGRDLLFIKSALPHGEFLPYLDKEFALSDDTAQNYMNLAKLYKGRQIPNASEFGLTALINLAKPSTPKPAIEEAVERQSNGEQMTAAKTRELVARHKAELKEAEKRGRESAADDIAAEKARAEAAEAEREEADREANRAKNEVKRLADDSEAEAAERERRAREEERQAAERRFKKKEDELERERRKLNREIDAAKAAAKSEGVAEAKAQVEIIDRNVRALEVKRDAVAKDLNALEEQRARVKSQDERDISTFSRLFAELEDSLEGVLGIVSAHQGVITDTSLKRNGASIRRLMGYLEREMVTVFDEGAVVIDMVAS